MHDIWNPWHGCKKVSEGCANCYMYFLDKKRGSNGSFIYKTQNFDYPLQKTRTGGYKIKSGEFIRVCMTSDFFLEDANLNIGESFQLEATILPEDTTDPTVTWSSSNEFIASVSEEGLVTAISPGEAIITATCGEVSAECIITVLEDAGVESLLANPESKISVYSVEGVLIKKDCKAEDLKSLATGIYIIVSGKDRYKISI